MKKSDEALQNWRDQIDSLDVELLRLLARRMEKVRSIGQYKKHHNLEPLSPTRQQAVLKSWVDTAEKLQLDPGFVTQLYGLVHDYALKLEADK